MQCQGKTRSGKRCRNRSLDSELFCDIHMRVDHSYNLALLLPLILGVLVTYFFIFGMFFNTVVFGIFDVNYLKYVGLEDLLLNMVRFGGTITLIILLIWVSYAVILSTLCGIWLVFRMVKTTGQSNLKFTDRLKVIALSLAIYLFHLFSMLVVLFPKRNRKRFDKVILTQQKLAHTLQELRTNTGSPIKGKPLINAQDIFQNFLYFRSVGNHRFLMSIVLLFLVTLGITYYTGGEAENARNCTIMKSGIEENYSTSSIPFPAFILERDCQLTEDISQDPKGLTATFARALSGIFKFTPVIVQSGDGQIPLLHLASTSRFDLFFNGADGHALALPRGILTLQDTVLDDKESLPLFANLEKQFSELGQNLSQSNQALFGLGRDLKETNEELDRLNKTTFQIARHQFPNTIPAPQQALIDSCGAKDPALHVQFIKGAYILNSASTLKSILRLSKSDLMATDQPVLVSGFADPHGDDDMNLRLSTRRAQHVVLLLQKLGIDQQRLFALGMGENNSRLLPRRRVEIRICNSLPQN